MTAVAGALKARLRVRVCGLAVDAGRVLMVYMHAPTHPLPFWTPPGGGLEFGETMHEGVRREVREETGLDVEPVRLMYVSEFVNPPFHALEVYWECRLVGGSLALGLDPEFAPNRQMLQKAEFLDLASLADLPVFPEYLRVNLENDLSDANFSVRHFIQKL